MSRSRSGSDTTGLARTSSSPNSLVNLARGLAALWREFFTFTRAKSSVVAPWSSMRRRAWSPKYTGLVAPTRRKRSQSMSSGRSPALGARKPLGVVSAPTTRATSQAPDRIWPRAVCRDEDPEAQAA